MNVVANGVRLFVKEVGTGSPVVFLHGLGLSHEMFRNQIPVLAERNRAIAFDLRGMGRSEAPGKRGTTNAVEQHANDLAGLLDELGIDTAMLVGHAYGGFVAMQFAITRSTRARALAVVNTTAWMGEPGTSQALYRAATADWDGMDPLLDTAMSRWFVKRVHQSRPETVAFYRRMLAATPPLGYAASARSIAGYDIRERLGAIRCPMLVVSGAQDWSTPPAHHELITRAVADARLEVLDDASHTVPEERADDFTRLLSAFVAGVGD